MRKEYRRNKAKTKFVNYMYKTWKNKLCAIVLFTAGMLGAIVNGEGLLFILLSILAGPMFLAKNDRFQ